MKMVNIEEENCHTFTTIWRISMTFSGNMGIIILLLKTEKQGSLENKVLEVGLN